MPERAARPGPARSRRRGSRRPCRPPCWRCRPASGVRLERDARVGLPKREQPGVGRGLRHRAALRRVGRCCPRRRPAPRSWPCRPACPGRCPPAHSVRRVVAGPDARDGVDVRRGRDEARGAVGGVDVAAGAGGRAAGEDLLDLPGAQGVRARQLLGEHRRVGRGLDALPDEAAGLLVVAVAGALERRVEADVDVGLRHADDPRDAAQRLVLVPEELRQRRAQVVEEVDAVEVEDVDGARPVVRDAVLVLAPQAQVGPISVPAPLPPPSPRVTMMIPHLTP